MASIFRRDGRRVSGVALYVVPWIVGSAVAVGVLALVLDGNDEATVALPPVRQTDLPTAARTARCELVRVAAGEVSNPPVSGPAASVPVSPGFKRHSPDVPSLIATLRRGVLVIHFRTGLDEQRVAELRKMQEAVPAGTVVTPNTTGMPYEVAATAYRRLLGCPRFTDATLDALRLFRGRFLGSGPDG